MTQLASGLAPLLRGLQRIVEVRWQLTGQRVPLVL